MFVLTVTVSLALVTTPLPVGVRLSATVVPVVILMTLPTDALIVVFAVVDAADATIGDATTAANEATAIKLVILVFLFIPLFS